jgi:hypothetical protein
MPAIPYPLISRPPVVSFHPVITRSRLCRYDFNKRLGARWTRGFYHAGGEHDAEECNAKYMFHFWFFPCEVKYVTAVVNALRCYVRSNLLDIGLAVFCVKRVALT